MKKHQKRIEQLLPGAEVMTFASQLRHVTGGKADHQGISTIIVDPNPPDTDADPGNPNG